MTADNVHAENEVCCHHESEQEHKGIAQAEVYRAGFEVTTQCDETPCP